jgi:glycosyltransferase involved in cell wall biosynthesis
VPEADIFRVASALKELVDNVQFRKELREKGFEKVKNQFSITAMGDKLEKLIEEDLHE